MPHEGPLDILIIGDDMATEKAQSGTDGGFHRLFVTNDVKWG
jgi:hypothetical protein